MVNFMLYLFFYDKKNWKNKFSICCWEKNLFGKVVIVKTVHCTNTKSMWREAKLDSAGPSQGDRPPQTLCPPASCR